MADIFLSYARADKDRVRPLVELLERQGWSVFWDTQLIPGDQWRQHLLHEAQTCSACVVVWSAASVASEWVIEEATQAKLRKILVPVLLDVVEVPFGFRGLQAANISDWRPEDRWHEQASLLLSRLRTIIEKTEPAAPLSINLDRIGYAVDQRMIQAASDQVSPRELLDRYDFSRIDSSVASNVLPADAEGGIWLDFAADMGGHPEPGLTLAYLMAFDSLQIENVGRLQHGALLVTSDGLAPADIDRFSYEFSVRQKFDIAQGKSAKRRLFALSGPYENLLGQRLAGHVRRVIREFLLIRPVERSVAWFDALFCSARQGQGAELGIWKCNQHRSYWAVRLPFNWLIWGLDVPIDAPLDAAQLNYFERIADRTSPQDRIIICLAQAPWLADRQTKRSDPVAELVAIAQKNDAKVSAFLAGGAHHYSRYFCKELQLHCIAAGGATGALQPTHYLNLKEEMSLAGARQRLNLRAMIKNGKRTRRPACWPSRGVSRFISLRALTFPFRNYRFAVALGVAYWILIWLFATTPLPAGPWRGTVGTTLIADPSFSIFPDIFLVTPLALASNNLLGGLALAFWVVLYIYADPQQGRNLRALAATLHWAAHMAMMILLYFIVSWGTVYVMDWLWPQIADSLRSLEIEPSSQMKELMRAIVFFPLIIIFLGGLGPGFVWGLYLLFSTLFLRMHRAEAFDALGILDYKTFLRMRFSKDGAVIYPIGIKDILRSRDWRRPPADSTEGAALVPARPIAAQLIEGPIVLAKGS